MRKVVKKRYIDWYDKEIGYYEKNLHQTTDEEMPYLSGRVIYSFMKILQRIWLKKKYIDGTSIKTWFLENAIRYDNIRTLKNKLKKNL